MNRLVPLAVLLPLLTVTGCAGGSAGSASAAAAPTPQASLVAAVVPSPRALPACTGVSAAGPVWPTPIPTDLPAPPSGQITAVKHTAEGLTVVNFTTSTSLRDGVLFLVKQLPAAGYTLGRGDAETAEADAPFNRGAGLRGVYRMVSKDLCNTLWLLAVSNKVLGGASSPLVAPHVGPSPSPLPFG